MKPFNKIIALVALIVSAIACDTPEEPDNVVTNDRPTLKVEAAPAADFTRATDTAFEKGDSFSLFAVKGEGFDNLSADNIANLLQSLQPWISNAKFTKGDGGFTSQQEYKWYEGDEVSSFAAIYPYIADCQIADVLISGVDFCVKSDQSTHSLYTASDLMAAYKSGVAPTEQAVRLEFNHLLSKIVIDLNNQTGEDIEEVFVDGVRGNMTYSLTSTAPTGDYGTIKAGELATPSAGYTDTFVLIIPPQGAAPKVAITTASGKQYTFEAPEEINFGVGKKRHITVTLTPESISTDFDAIVNDWSADEDVEFTDQPGGGDIVAPTDEGYKVTFNGQEYNLAYDQTAGNWVGSFTTIADQADFMLVNSTTGATFGGECICTGNSFRLTEGDEKITLPAVSETVDYTITLITEGEGAPRASLRPDRVGDYSLIGLGQAVENHLFGVITPSHVLQHSDGSYMFFTPVGAIARTMINTYPDTFCYADSDHYAASSYVTVSTEEAQYKGWDYTSVKISSITPGLKMKHNDTWNDLIYYSTLNSEDSVPYNRVVDNNNKIFQAAPMPYLVGLGSFETGRNGTWTFMLPGATMADIKYDWIDVNMGAHVTDPASIGINLYIERDVKRVTYAIFYDSIVTDEECLGVINQMIERNMMTELAFENPNDEDLRLGLAFSTDNGGTYSMVVAGYDAAGELCSISHANYNLVITPGIPSSPTGTCANISMVASLDTVRPDTEVCFEINGTDITSAYYSCLPAADYGHLSDIDLVNAAAQYSYRYLTGYLDFVNDGGYTESFTGLAPSTEYVLVGWFEDVAGGFSVIRQNITTDAATEWVSLGTGTYFDTSFLFPWGDEGGYYSSEVEILQDADGSVHYRIMAPYANYWASNSDKYAGFYGDYLEVAAYTMTDAEGNTTQHLCYDRHHTGKTEAYGDQQIPLVLEHPYNTSPAAQKYPMRDKHLSAYTSSPNKVIGEGLLQLAPWYMLDGRDQGYKLTDYDEVIVIALPGYSFEPTPPAESAAAIGGVRKGSKTTPVALTSPAMTDGGGVGTPTIWPKYRVKLESQTAVSAEKTIISGL